MEDVVDQCSIDKNDFEIQIKQLRIDNDKLLNQIMSQDIMHIAMTSVDNMDVNLSCVNECCHKKRTRFLKKLKDIIESLDGRKCGKKFQLEAPRIFKINLKPLAPKLLKNKDAHIDYIKHIHENAEILRELVKNARASFPITSSSNVPKQTNNLKSQDSNKPLLHSTRINCSTSASGSKPSGNTKNNRIPQSSSSNKINKVEEHSRSVKSRKNKINRVDKTKCNAHVMQSVLNANSVSEPISNALIKHSVRNAKFESLCARCNQCLFVANHDKCFIDYVNAVNVRSKAKSKKNKKRKVWKPTVTPR
ncbi:hypothetical protein Tco_0390795 [Tanacetum coccineum]